MQARKHASMHSHIHACMCTCMHTHIHTCLHSYTHTYMLACMHAYIHTYIHACIHTHIHTCLHACIHTYMHTYIHALVCNHGFRIFQQLTVNVHIFFPLPGLVFISFFLPFFISSTFIIVSLFFTFYVHPFSCRRHLLSSWHCLLHGLYSDICCHQCWSFVIVLFLGFIIFHIYIYIVAPPQVFCFKEIRKNPQEDHQTCKIPISILTLQMPFCIKKLQWVQENNVCYACCVSYFVSAPCHGTTLHPATKGGKWEGLF